MADPDPKELFLEVFPQLVGEDGDLGAMEDSLPQLTQLLEPVAAPDFVCVMQPLPPTPPRPTPGVEGVDAAWEDYGGAFETVRAKLEDVRESDDHIVMLVDQTATTPPRRRRDQPAERDADRVRRRDR